MDETRTQCAALLDYLKRNGAIDPMTALRELGIYRLAGRVWDLRAAGHAIETETTRKPARTIYRLKCNNAKNTCTNEQTSLHF